MAQDEGLENDLFAQCLLENTDTQGNGADYKPVCVNQDVMRSMRFEEIFIQDMGHFGANMTKRYYKNMVPDVAINMCENCCRFFIQDEYEFAYMEHGHCPFCKHVEKDKGQTKVFGSLADMRMRVTGVAHSSYRRLAVIKTCFNRGTVLFVIKGLGSAFSPASTISPVSSDASKSNLPTKI